MFYWLVPIIQRVFDILNLVIIIRVILSWVPHDRHNPIIKIIYDVTDPLFAPFQGRAAFSGFDFSPIIVLMILGFVRQLVLGLLVSF